MNKVNWPCKIKSILVELGIPVAYFDLMKDTSFGNFRKGKYNDLAFQSWKTKTTEILIVRYMHSINLS